MGVSQSAEYGYDYNSPYQSELEKYYRRMYPGYYNNNSFYQSAYGQQQTPNYYNAYQQYYQPSAYQSYNGYNYGTPYQQPSYYGGYSTTPQYYSSMYGTPTAYGNYNSNYYPYNVQRSYL